MPRVCVGTAAVSTFFVEQARSSFHRARDIVEEDEVRAGSLHAQNFSMLHPWPQSTSCGERPRCGQPAVVQALISNYRLEFTGRHRSADDYTWCAQAACSCQVKPACWLLTDAHYMLEEDLPLKWCVS